MKGALLPVVARNDRTALEAIQFVRGFPVELLLHAPQRLVLQREGRAVRLPGLVDDVGRRRQEQHRQRAAVEILCRRVRAAERLAVIHLDERIAVPARPPQLAGLQQDHRPRSHGQDDQHEEHELDDQRRLSEQCEHFDAQESPPCDPVTRTRPRAATPPELCSPGAERTTAESRMAEHTRTDRGDRRHAAAAKHRSNVPTGRHASPREHRDERVDGRCDRDRCARRPHPLHSQQRRRAQHIRRTRCAAGSPPEARGTLRTAFARSLGERPGGIKQHSNAGAQARDLRPLRTRRS